jgi:hypothetical protein
VRRLVVCLTGVAVVVDIAAVAEEVGVDAVEAVEEVLTGPVLEVDLVVGLAVGFVIDLAADFVVVLVVADDLVVESVTGPVVGLVVSGLRVAILIVIAVAAVTGLELGLGLELTRLGMQLGIWKNSVADAVEAPAVDTVEAPAVAVAAMEFVAVVDHAVAAQAQAVVTNVKMVIHTLAYTEDAVRIPAAEEDKAAEVWSAVLLALVRYAALAH